MEDRDTDTDRMKALKKQLAGAAPTSPEDETAGGIARQRGILAEMDAERFRADQEREAQCNAKEAARERDRLSKIRTDGGRS
jgi:hypothetical protein